MFENITTAAVSSLEVFANWSPLYSLLLISFFVGIISTLSYKYLTNQKLMKETKEEIKKSQEEMKLLKDNPSKMMEKQSEIMRKNFSMMKESYKSILYTFPIFIIIFLLIQKVYTPFGKISLFGLFGLTWLWIYIISSFIFSIILRKWLKVY